MIERTLSLRLKPGIYRNGTRYQAKNRWFDANGVRWYEGIVGPIGGWRNVVSQSESGTATGTQTATTLQDTTKTWLVDQWIGRTVSILSGTGAGQVRIVASNTANTVTLTVAWSVTPDATSVYTIGGVSLQVTGHPRAAYGWRANDGISHMGIGTHSKLWRYTDGRLEDVTPRETGTATGTQTATTLQDTTKTWAVNRFSGQTVTITGGTGAGQVRVVTSNTANTLTVSVAWGTIPDGTSTYSITDFPLTVGDFEDGAFVAGNYGSGGFGEGYYGTGSGALTLVAPSTWTLDNFGERLVACHTLDGRLLQALPGGGPATVVDPTAPVSNTAVVVTPEHFIVALGANGNSRRVKWPDQESLSDWAITAENQANEFDLPTKGRLVCGRRTRRQTILWTDVDVFAMSYNGGIDVYGFEQLGDNCGIIGPQAAAVLGDRMFWMSYGKFFEYDGALKPIRCDVLDEVFGSLDQSQRAKIQAIPMTLFNEVWWTYPVKDTTSYECTRFVGYNYQEDHWIMGELPRAAGIDRGVYEFPVLLDFDGFLFEHEIGGSRTGMDVFAETGPIEIGEGDQLMRVQHYIPDEKTLGDVTVTLFGANHPTATERKIGPFTASEPTPLRLTARQVRLRVDEVEATDWRVGVPKLGVIPAGNR